MSQLPPDKVTLEDLLRLKRAERPPAEFWAQFDRELQAKQLAALVGKKRWWHPAARTFTRFSYLPLGATVALAFAAMVAHQYLSPATKIAGSGKLPAPVAKIALAPAAVRTEVAALAPAPAAVPTEKTNSTLVASMSPADHPEALVSTRELPTAITWLPDTLQTTDTTSLSEHSIAVSFSDERFVSPRLASNLGSMGEVKSHRTSDPLTQVSSPTETQHARLLAALTDVRLVSAVDPVTLMHQRLSTRMGDDGLADDAGRFDASGNSVSVKF
jgi:hypothetical protein